VVSGLEEKAREHLRISWQERWKDQKTQVSQNSSLVDATTVESLEEALLETNHFSFRSGSE